MEPSDLHIQGGPCVGAADEGTEVEGHFHLQLGPQVLLGPGLPPRTTCSPLTVHEGHPWVGSQAALLLTPPQTGLGACGKKVTRQVPDPRESFTVPAP